MGTQKKSSKFLLKTASPATFLSPPRSPIRSNTVSKKLPSPRVSLVPKEIRRRASNLSFDAREPTSPKLSCLGQFKKNKKKNMKEKKKLFVCSCNGAMIRMIFNGKKRIGEANSNNNIVLDDHKKEFNNLKDLKQFASNRRNGLQNFDLNNDISVVAGNYMVESNCTKNDGYDDEKSSEDKEN